MCGAKRLTVYPRHSRRLLAYLITPDMAGAKRLTKYPKLLPSFRGDPSKNPVHSWVLRPRLAPVQ